MRGRTEKRRKGREEGENRVVMKVKVEVETVVGSGPYGSEMDSHWRFFFRKKSLSEQVAPHNFC